MRLLFSIPVLLAFLLILPHQTHAEEELTAAGRWSAGGSLSFPFEYNKYRRSIFGFSIRPEATLFLWDNFEIAGGLTLTNVLDYSYVVDARPQTSSNFFWGTQLGAHYFLPIKSNFRPYFGANFGFLMNRWEYKQIVWFVQIPIGVSWFVNPHIAIQFGIPISIDFSSTAFFEKVTIDPGYLGVRAFF